MRTLKKTLSLVLALVLCFGLVGTAFAANVDAYTDAADLGAAYAEAAEVMMGLGVIKGMSATELGATGTLTREQAAKIVAYIALGNTVADMLKADKAPFDDVAADRWSAGYISYCADKGILAGYGNGKFGPADELTGFQFAKMLLVALGYGAANEFTPESWSINTATLGFSNNIFAGDAAAAVHTPITRQQAMLMAFNALYVDRVAYSKDIANYGSNPTATNFAADTFKLNVVDNEVITANQATGNTATVATNNYAFTTGLDMIGHVAKVYFIDAATAGFDVGEKVVAIVDKTAEVAVTATTTQTQLKTALAALGVTAGATVNKIKDGAASGNGTQAVPFATSNTAAGFVGTVLVANKAIVGVKVADTVVTAKVDAVTTTTPGSETITLNSTEIQNNASNDDIVEYAGIKQNDYVTYVKVGDIYNVTKAETVEGKITKKAGTTLTVNGKDYKAFAGTDSATVTGEVAYNAATYADTYKLYLAPDGTYFALVKVTTDTSVAAGIVYPTLKYTKAVAATTDAYGNPLTPAATLYFVQAVDSTGAEVNYQVTSTEYAAITEKNLYTVKTDYDNTLKATVADLTAVTAGTTTGGISVPASTTIAANAIKVANNYYFASGVKFIFVNGTGATLKTTVKDGVQAISATNVVYYGTKAATAANYDVQYVFVDAAFVADNTGTGIMAGFEAADSTTTVPYTTALGTTAEAFVHTVYIDGVKTEILTATDDKIVGFSTYTYDAATGLYAVGADYSSNVKAGKITNNYNGKISNGAATDLDVSNAKIVNVVAPTDTNYSKIATTAAGLTTHETVSVVCTNLGVATVVYITAYTA